MTHSDSISLTRHHRLNTCIDQVFNEEACTPLVSLSNEAMPPLLSRVPVAVSTIEHSHYQELIADNTRLRITEEGGLRIYLNNEQITTDVCNIPNTYPWFYSGTEPETEEPESIGRFAEHHVARGIRYLDPWDEADWPAVNGVQQGHQNWPPLQGAFGPCQLQTVAYNSVKAVTAQLYAKALPSAYQTIPRAVFALQPDQSMVLALQQENRHPSLNWAAWFVLGFALPAAAPHYQNPTSLCAFPDNEFLETPVVTHKVTKLWNYWEIAGQRVAVIHPHVKTLNEPFKKIYSDVNWSILAHKGSQDVIVIRSMLRHHEQFFPFLEHGNIIRSEQGILTRQGGFLEVEHTGCKVPFGMKSAVMVKIDCLPVVELTQGKISQLSTQNPAFEQEFALILQAIVPRLSSG